MITPALQSKWNQIPFLTKVVVGFCIGLFGLALLFAPSPQPVDWQLVSFTTKTPDLLYFKNVRSYYYRLTEDDKSGFHLYRNKGFAFPEFEEPLRLMLVQNWRSDEAFIFFELNEAYPNGQLAWDGLQKPLALTHQNTEQQFEIAAQLYNALLMDVPIFLDQNGAKTPLFDTHRYRRAVIVTLEDYFKLVGKI